MKGVLRTGGVLLAAAGLVVVGRSWSGPPAKPAPPKSRIGLVNLAYVFKYSERWQRNQAELNATYERYEKRVKELQVEIDELGKALKVPGLGGEKREAVLAKRKKELEDNNATAKQTLGEMSDKHMVAIFNDLQKVSERYANDHDLDAVFMYTEAVDAKDYLNPNNILAKLQNRACFPLYNIPGLDVSKEIVAAINAKKGWEVAPAAPAKE